MFNHTVYLSGAKIDFSSFTMLEFWSRLAREIAALKMSPVDILRIETRKVG